LREGILKACHDDITAGHLRKDHDVRQGTAAVFLEQLSRGRGSLRQSL
jgi:hypothetical protein